MQWEEEKPKCPSCGAVPAPKAEECAVCGVIFAKWRKKQASELPPSDRQLDAPPPILVRDKDSTVALFARFVGIALVLAAGGLGWWLLSGGTSRPPVAGAVRDEKLGVAFVAPTAPAIFE